MVFSTDLLAEFIHRPQPATRSTNTTVTPMSIFAFIAYRDKRARFPAPRARAVLPANVSVMVSWPTYGYRRRHACPHHRRIDGQRHFSKEAGRAGAGGRAHRYRSHRAPPPVAGRRSAELQGGVRPV